MERPVLPETEAERAFRLAELNRHLVLTEAQANRLLDAGTLPSSRNQLYAEDSMSFPYPVVIEMKRVGTRRSLESLQVLTLTTVASMIFESMKRKSVENYHHYLQETAWNNLKELREQWQTYLSRYPSIIITHVLEEVFTKSTSLANLNILYVLLNGPAKMHEATGSYVVKQYLQKYPPGPSIIFDFLQNFFGNVTSLIIDRYFVSKKTLNSILQQCENINRLTMKESDLPGLQYLVVTIARYCKYLEVLDISKENEMDPSTDYPDDTTDSDVCNSLKEFKCATNIIFQPPTDQNDLIHRSNISDFLERTPNMEHLLDCVHSGEGLSYLIHSGKNYPKNIRSIHDTWNFGTLKYTSKECEHLKILKLGSQSSEFQSSEIRIQNFVEPLLNLADLTSLEIHNFMWTELMCYVKTRGKSLRKIKLSGVQGTVDFEELKSNCQNITEMQVEIISIYPDLKLYMFS